MSRTVFAISVVFAAAVAPLAAHAQTPITFKSQSIDVPDRGTLFTGSGSDAINNNCLACHSAGMVLNQPSMTKAAWQAEVNKMIHVFKAPVIEDDVPAIVDYLSRTKGKK